MFESEVNSTVEDIGQIPEEILGKFSDSSKDIKARSLIYWGEHCTECNWPSCYSSCELFDPRNDMKCRQFIDGSIRLKLETGINSYLLKIKFKRWGKLWSIGNTKLFSLKQAKTIERIDELLGNAVQNLPTPKNLKSKIISKYSSLKKMISESYTKIGDKPTHFVFECFNPNPSEIQISLTIKNRNKINSKDPSCAIPSLINFQKLLELKSGYNFIAVPFEEIESKINFKFSFDIELIPNNIVDGTTLFFGLMDFAVVNQKEKKRICKCVIWDLDNTIWDGILVEDGPENLKLKPGIKELINELDQKGILNSIASKNNEKDALEVLKKFELQEYFLYPQISWGPKSIAVANIIKQLNIGQDSVVFIDDQKFEREEVNSTLSDLICVDAQNYKKLLEMTQFKVSVTEESKKRRLMYKEEMKREEVLQSQQGNYIGFLKSCNLKAYLAPLNKNNIERVYELAQRTNQMNFSGNRYEKSELLNFMNSEKHHTYVVDCTDNFGSYGIVGFGIVEIDEPRLIDLLFSCRIQSKHVEHSIITYLVRKYNSNNTREFLVNYKKTEKNKSSGKVFYDLGFKDISEKNGISTLVFSKDSDLIDEGIVEVQFKAKN